jgi:hypothetical protein
MKSETTRITPFFANYSYYPRLGIEPFDVPDTPAARQADTFVDHMLMILEFLREQTILAQARYEDTTNCSCSTAPRFDIG